MKVSCTHCARPDLIQRSRRRFSAASVNWRASSTVGGGAVACGCAALAAFCDWEVINPPVIRIMGSPVLTQNDQIFARRERTRGRSLVLNRNWRSWCFAAPGVATGTAEWGVLDRPGALVVIFTDSSSSCGARNAKGCVCTGSCRPGRGAALEPVQQSARQYI